LNVFYLSSELIDQCLKLWSWLQGFHECMLVHTF